MCACVCAYVHAWAFASEFIQRNHGLTNLKGPKILFFIAGIFVIAGAFYYKINYKGI
jgi:hypothetical protein